MVWAIVRIREAGQDEDEVRCELDFLGHFLTFRGEVRRET